MNFLTSNTYSNLQKAFDGECAAHTRYQIYASILKNMGFGYLSDIFIETSKNELEHAEKWLKYLNKEQKVDDLLLESLKNEHYENTTMYKDFARIAREEGFEDIAKAFEMVSSIEFQHENRFHILLDLYKDGKLNRADTKVIWHCSSCGFEIESNVAPEKCPFCGHQQAYYYPRKKIYY